MKHLSSDEIIKEYKKGRKNFSKIECKSGNFSEQNLKGIIFRGSDLEGSSFSGCNLDNADFSSCNLQWINFDHTILRRTNFANADLRWAKSTSPTFDRTVFKGANLDEAYIFKADMGSADFTNASKKGMATKFSDISDTDFMTAEHELGRRGISFDVIMSIKSGIEKMRNGWKRFIGVSEEKKAFSKYNKQEKETNADQEYGNKIYVTTDSIYNNKIKYGKKREK